MLATPTKAVVKMVAEVGYDDGNNALHCAVVSCVEAVALLCKHGPPEIFSQVNNSGYTPMMFCIYKKEPAALATMLSDGPWGEAASAALALGVMKKKKRGSQADNSGKNLNTKQHTPAHADF